MLKTTESGRIFWNDKQVGTHSIPAKSEPMNVVKYSAADDRVQDGGDTELVLRGLFDSIKLINEKTNNSLEKTSKACRRTNHNFRVVAKKLKEIEKFDNQRDECLLELLKKVEHLEDSLGRLQEQKLDKPSHSQDMINAEAYIDDYKETKRRFARERWARRQRIRKKLKNMEKPHKQKKQGGVNVSRLAWFVSVLSGILLIILMGIG